MYTVALDSNTVPVDARTKHTDGQKMRGRNCSECSRGAPKTFLAANCTGTGPAICQADYAIVMRMGFMYSLTICQVDCVGGALAGEVVVAGDDNTCRR
jgi:hypothetical protein